MNVELNAEDWMARSLLSQKKYLFTVYQCNDCELEFADPILSTEEETLILKGRRNLRESLLIVLLCLMIIEYSIMLALATAVSIFILKDIQSALIVSKSVKKGRCPYCLGHEYRQIQ